jgi:hypothetical protein
VRDRRIAAGQAVCAALLMTAFVGDARAQAVTMDDLAGHFVVADIYRQQTVRRDGRTATVKVHQNWAFSINSEHAIALTMNVTAETPRGTRKAKPRSNTFVLDETVKVKARGGGQAVWTFADNTLTFTRTFPAGAYRAHFAFARGPKGLTCRVTEAFAREGGKGELKMDSPFGGEVTILSTKQLPSTCRIAKKQ